MPVSNGHLAWGFVPSDPVPCFSGIRSKRSLECDDSRAVQDNILNEQVQTSAKRVCLRDSLTQVQQPQPFMQETLPGCLKDSTQSMSSLPASSQSSLNSNDRNNSSNVMPTTAKNTTTVILPSMVDGYHNSYNNYYVINNHQTSSSIVLSDKPSSDHSDNNNNNNDVSGADHVPMDDEMECNVNATGPCDQENNNTFTTNTHNGISGSDSGTNDINGHDSKICIGEESTMVTMETESNPSIQQYQSSPVVPASPRMSNGVFCGFSSCRGLKPSPVSGRSFCHCFGSWRGMYGMEGAYFNDYY